MEVHLHTRNTPGDLAHVRDTQSAASEFEAVLIGQMLESAFANTGFGEGDSGAQTMMDFGREHLSRVIAKGGGLGLAKLVEAGLGKPAKTT